VVVINQPWGVWDGDKRRAFAAAGELDSNARVGVLCEVEDRFALRLVERRLGSLRSAVAAATSPLRGRSTTPAALCASSYAAAALEKRGGEESSQDHFFLFHNLAVGGCFGKCVGRWRTRSAMLCYAMDVWDFEVI
jgi:hypothetical protein